MGHKEEQRKRIGKARGSGQSIEESSLQRQEVTVNTCYTQLYFNMIDISGRNWKMDELAGGQVILHNRKNGKTQRVIFKENKGEFYLIKGEKINFKVSGVLKLKFVPADSSGFNNVKFMEASVAEMVAGKNINPPVPMPAPVDKVPAIPAVQSTPVSGAADTTVVPAVPVVTAKKYGANKFRILDAFFNPIEVEITKQNGKYVWPSVACAFSHENLDIVVH